jgi:hypothetical protein
MSGVAQKQQQTVAIEPMRLITRQRGADGIGVGSRGVDGRQYVGNLPLNQLEGPDRLTELPAGPGILTKAEILRLARLFVYSGLTSKPASGLSRRYGAALPARVTSIHVAPMPAVAGEGGHANSARMRPLATGDRR